MTDSTTNNILSLNDYSIGYQKENTLLSHLNLSVNRGEMVALIGRNGTGKSTLLKSIIGLMAPMEGLCLFEGRPISEYTIPERARRVSYVSSQVAQLPSLTVRELLGLGRMPYTGWMGRLTREDRAVIEQAIKEVQMGALADRKLEILSDGERQRAMIARAFVQDTALMVLDEPTAFLDIPNTFELIELLSRFRDGGRSIVYSTHDLGSAMQCADKMWVIHQGRILEGAPEDLGITGLFNELFSSSGIRYDEHLGRFLFEGNLKGVVSVTGEREDLLIWARHTMERLGYKIEKGADLQIRVEVSTEGVHWILKSKGGSSEYENLYDLARFLIQE
jgi:iron complex transport system ATP-binding protein